MRRIRYNFMWLAVVRWCYLGASPNKTGYHDKFDILLRSPHSLSQNDHWYFRFFVIRFPPLPHVWFITGLLTRLTRRVLLVKQIVLALPEYTSSSPISVGFAFFNLYFAGATSESDMTRPSGIPEFISDFSGIRVFQSLFFCVSFDRPLFVLFFLCLFGHCVVCSSSIHGFSIPLWCLQTFLTQHIVNKMDSWQI